ncbi:GCN5-related N-acetyltransferase [Frankia sp. Hr75.2]|uniref:GNAT family N-acetyltransferase n=1 Tax=unclassified Parafrankia TaxID=2994368 RepID=UPI0000544FB2|nr:GNAT family N-acetyltransferase [Parafrankia sp. Ea1.12]ABW11606.1 GCN5-related N-acetyltransferase [Frankia sp. EAN1pec]CAI7976912.1 GCN5-related N-acetyltransferase [Frankia sp. Hr75.2]SQD95111.1 GCN5-related N-acetyltransferase [Parafrankia sp. Ea1.12]
MPFTKPSALVEDHDTVAFGCGDPVLDSWLRHHAKDHQRERITSTFVLLDGSTVAGYYCLATAAAERVGTASRWRSRRPVDPVPMMLVGRLAVDVRYQGRGVGARLVRDATMRALTVRRMVGTPLLGAHATAPDGQSFYRHLGFVPTALDPHLVLLPLQNAAGSSA